MQKQNSKFSFLHKPVVQSGIGVIFILGILGGFIFWRSVSAYVSIDTSQISAPMISIGPESIGILSEVYVKAGDTVYPGQALARVGPETITSEIEGLVINVNNTPGQVFGVGSPVVTMIDPNELRVVGKIDEDKGFSKIKVGDSATFTVDAFGSTKFTGIVDEVSATSNQSGVAFSISGKRETKQFNVKVRYDSNLNAQFKNGMSARLKIYTR